MRESLLTRCEAQIRNEAELRMGHKLEFESIMKLAAMMYVNAGREVDVARLRACKQLLKDRVGIFSNFRGYMQYLVQVKMALADDPEAYIDGVLDVYQRLKAGRVLPGEMVAMAATTIYENSPVEKHDEIVDKTRDAYERIRGQHPFLTGEEDLALIALMIIVGIDPIQAAEKAEELFLILKERYLPGSDTPQSVAMVLALSDKPAKQKITDFVNFYNECKRAGCATSKDKAMTIYAAYADLEGDRAQIIAEIGEVDEWLKEHKGYGALGVGASIRRLIAATLVLEDRQEAIAASVGATSVVAQAVVEELLLVLMSIIVTAIVVNSIVRSGS